MIENSRREGKSVKGRPTTEGGKPLLQVCIENEQAEGKWKLKGCMESLLMEDKLEDDVVDLMEDKCDPNTLTLFDEYNMISYCVIHSKERAFKLILEKCKWSLDPNMKN